MSKNFTSIHFLALAVISALGSYLSPYFRMTIYTAPVIGNLFGINLTLPEKNVLEISTGISTEKVISVSQKENYLQQVETETGVYEFSRNINTYEKYVFMWNTKESIYVCFNSEHVNTDSCKKAKQINS